MEVADWQGYFLPQPIDTLDGEAALMLFNQATDIWAQDFLIPAYASMTGPNSPIVIQILLCLAQSNRPAGRQVFTQLRGPGVGGFQSGRGSGFSWEEVNSGANIEAILPYTSQCGKAWPNGRVIMGSHRVYTLPSQW